MLVGLFVTKAYELGLQPLTQIIQSTVTGIDPWIMVRGPSPGIHKVLNRAKLQLSDLRLVKLNEVFAVHAPILKQELGLSHEITNFSGGYRPGTSARMLGPPHSRPSDP